MYCSAIPTETPGRVDKSAAIASLQQSGESYDRVRETLKHVSVDASGKVELEDWVEVRAAQRQRFHYTHRMMFLTVGCVALHR